MSSPQASTHAARAPNPPLAPAGALHWAGLALLAAALVLVMLAEFSNLDLVLADRSYDAALQAFPWRDHWFASTLMHRWVRLPLILLGSALGFAAVTESALGWPRLDRPDRWRLRASAVIAGLVPLAIALAKRQSASHCPWSLERYGGHQPYLRLFDALPAGIDPGGCFPAGHASSALWLAGLCIWFLPHRPRAAAAVFAAGLTAGFALGWVQQMRGAHFLSHTLWSMWIAAALVWTVVYALALVERAHAILPAQAPAYLR